MIIDTPGKVTDRILLLGRKESCAYVLRGKGEYALLGGGMTYVIPEVVDQLKEFEIDEKKIKRIVILHSHFDHCGMVPFLKRRWPWARITASSRAKELLSTPRIIESIDKLNTAVLTEYGMERLTEDPALAFGAIAVEDVVKGGDLLSCGDLSMKVIDVPGHSSCSIAVYVGQEKAMFASDAAGIPFKNRIFTAANSNFDKYQKSLEKMGEYEIDVILAEHFGARTGDDGRDFIKNSIVSAEETRDILETSYARLRDVEKCTDEVTDALMERLPEDFMPKDIITLVAGQMVKFIAKKNAA
ncbi:MAG: MBL fold metallo-hydrolase [Deltaproteobacteria bacterium]|nr:MBL fold metallo-hydrolase [Deltaproteobacteria bacterium]MBW2193598.1 MBL fold metallo-hydrolase [Deltaproteobacteria bacterium]